MTHERWTPSRRSVLAGAVALAAAASAPRGAAAAGAIRVGDPEMLDVVDPASAIRTLHDGGRWCEGLCWAPQFGGLVFSDVRRNAMMVIDPAGGAARTFRDPSQNANGNILDRQGRLVTCEHRTRRVVRQEADGTLAVLADRFEGRRLNSPNDLALAADGALWFTDPVFGIRQRDEGLTAQPEQRARRVYRIPPGGGEPEAATDALDQPNGLVFAPDGGTLYVAETGAALNPEGGRAILTFPVEGGRALGAPRLFARYRSGNPDGLDVDRDGRLFAASSDGVRIYAPDGRLLGLIATATPCANIAFGGADGRQLFIGEGRRILAVDLRTRGAAAAHHP